MKILGIETSCDETAVCLIEAHGDFGADFEYTVLGNTLRSQATLHAEFGGVFPNLARREHQKNLVPLLAECLKLTEFRGPNSEANLADILAREPELRGALEKFIATHGRPNIDAIAVTHGPGLEPALWVGINFAKALSALWDVPIVAVDHMEGHAMMAMVSENGAKDVAFPALALLISGGHTELNLMPRWMQYERIGETLDDAVGEAFDKVARMLGLPYPGGPEIARLADLAREKSGGEASRFALPRPMIHEKNFDFSFSGLKTAVRNVIGGRTLTEAEKMEIAREFEDAAADVLVKKTLRAKPRHRRRRLGQHLHQTTSHGIPRKARRCASYPATRSCDRQRTHDRPRWLLPRR